MKLKKTLVSVLACALSLVMVFAFAACGNNTPKVTGISLDKETVSVATGESVKLNASEKYSDDTTKDLSASDVEWTTSNAEVATVVRGSVSGKKAGSATITAKSGDFTATCAVTVYSMTVEISEATATIEKGATKQLTATVKKDGAAQTDETIEWTSSNESVATVDENGLVTARSEGTATVTAKREKGNQSASCEVTVQWTSKPAGYKEIANFEQNKVPVNTWGYWNDKNYNWAGTTMHEAYYEDYAADNGQNGYIGAGKATFDFTFDNVNTEHPAIIQLVYRSAGEGGKLETNHDYKLTFKINSSHAGSIIVNPRLGAEETEAKDIIKGETAIEVTFRHSDWGYIYKEGVYDNIESALFVQLGNLCKVAELGEHVTVSIYDLKWQDLGETAEPLPNPAIEQAPPEIPDLKDVNAVALSMSTEDTKYAITTADEGKSYNVVYTDVAGGTYANIPVDITGTDAANGNVFAVTIKNNGTSAITLRFDIAGTAIVNGANLASRDCAVKSVASEGEATTNGEWDGTTIKIEAGATTTLYIYYDVSTDRGAPTELLIYFETFYYENDPTNENNVGSGSYSGNVTLSGFKFANVTEGN